RGVLPDKLLALSLISAPTQHPLYPARSLSPFSFADNAAVPRLFASLLSNTMQLQDPETEKPFFRIRQYDMNLRKRALSLLAREIAQPGRNPEAAELIRVESVTPESITDDDPWKRLQGIRTEIREFYATLMLDQVG